MTFVNANEKGTTVAGTHWKFEKFSELKQLVCFKDVLVSLWKPGDVLYWGRSFVLVSTEEKLWIPSKFVKIQLEKKKALEKQK